MLCWFQVWFRFSSSFSYMFSQLVTSRNLRDCQETVCKVSPSHAGIGNTYLTEFTTGDWISSLFSIAFFWRGFSRMGHIIIISMVEGRGQPVMKGGALSSVHASQALCNILSRERKTKNQFVKPHVQAKLTTVGRMWMDQIREIVFFSGSVCLTVSYSSMLFVQRSSVHSSLAPGSAWWSKAVSLEPKSIVHLRY